MKFAIVSGGTGGHIYPGIAIAEEIKRRYPQAEILFLGSEDGLEKDLICRAGYAIELIRARALLRTLSYKAISAPFISMIGYFQARSILKRFFPQALISTGGYVSLPAVLAAKTCSIPIYIHEQNVLPGFTNRLFRKWAKKVFLSFEASAQFMQGNVVGNPVRREIIVLDREKARRNLGVANHEMAVTVIGGSQGSRRINEVMVSALSLIGQNHLKILHVVGTRDMALVDKWLGNRKYPFYQRIGYVYNMAEALAASDLVISRAGATAIAEFLARGIPMVLVPFPFSAEGHQELNAKVVAEAGAGIIIKDADLTAHKIISVLERKHLDLNKMRINCSKLARPNAAEDIVNAIV